MTRGQLLALDWGMSTTVIEKSGNRHLFGVRSGRLLPSTQTERVLTFVQIKASLAWQKRPAPYEGNVHAASRRKLIYMTRGSLRAGSAGLLYIRRKPNTKCVVHSILTQLPWSHWDWSCIIMKAFLWPAPWTSTCAAFANAVSGRRVIVARLLFISEWMGRRAILTEESAGLEAFVPDDILHHSSAVPSVLSMTECRSAWSHAVMGCTYSGRIHVLISLLSPVKGKWKAYTFASCHV